MKLILALALMVLSTPSLADHPMPPAPDGLPMTAPPVECTDNQTQAAGLCGFWGDAAGNTYLMFIQEDEPVFIRQVYTDGRPYVDLWVADRYNTF